MLSPSKFFVEIFYVIARMKCILCCTCLSSDQSKDLFFNLFIYYEDKYISFHSTYTVYQ